VSELVSGKIVRVCVWCVRRCGCTQVCVLELVSGEIVRVCGVYACVVALRCVRESWFQRGLGGWVCVVCTHVWLHSGVCVRAGFRRDWVCVWCVRMCGCAATVAPMQNGE